MYVNPTTKDVSMISGDCRDNGLTDQHVTILAERAAELEDNWLLTLCDFALDVKSPIRGVACELLMARLSAWDEDAEERASRDRVRTMRERSCADLRDVHGAQYSSAHLWAEYEQRREKELLDLEYTQLIEQD